LVTLTSHAINQEKQPSLSNRRTNWTYFSHLIQQRLTLKIPLKTEADIETAVKSFNDKVQWAGWKATAKLPAASRIHDFPITIKQKIAEKIKRRRDWHRFRTPECKRLLNAATQDLKQLLNRNKNDCIQTFLQGLQPTEYTDYSLWKATKKIKHVTKPSPPLRTLLGTWASSNVEKAHAFANHLANVFQPHPTENQPEEEEALTQLLETPYQLEPPINSIFNTLKFRQ
jgi:hypothetical protein